MRKRMLPLMMLLLLSSITACVNADKQTAKNMDMYTRVWDDIVNNRNIDEINETNFDPNVVLVTSPENIVGIEDFKNYYQNYLTGFSDITFTIKDVFGQGDKIVKHWNFKGKNTGEFFGMPATGRAVDIDGVTLVKMKDGKIAQEQDFMDSAVFMQQLGIVSDPANVNVIDSAYKSFAKGDIPAVLGVMDPDIVWNEAESNVYADGNPYIGPDAVLKGVFERIGKDYESFMLDSIQLHDMSNNQVLATLRYKAKLKKNGASYNAQVAHLWTLQDGKVIGFQQFVDTKKLADALKK